MTSNISDLVKVKPLEWLENAATTSLGDYVVRQTHTGVSWYALLNGAGVGTVDVRSAEEAKALAQADYEAHILAALTPTEQPEQCFSVKEGYCLQAYIDNSVHEPVEWVDPSEALSIRSAEDVRREAVQKCITELSEGYLNGDGLPAMVKRMSALIDTPQPKGGDDE